MPNAVSTVTYRIHSPQRTAAAFVEHFGYRIVSDSRLETRLASSWSAPDCAGRECIILQPQSRQPFFIRLIQGEPVESYLPLMTYGWNAAELLVRDVKALADALDDSPFEIIGGPRDLMNNGTAVALQVKGPCDELLYLTQISGKQMQSAYGHASCEVDRLFIVVLGTDDHAGSLEFYKQLGAGITRPRRFAIRVLAAAHGLDSEHEFGIAGACLKEQYRIEVDAYPDSATRRQRHEGDIPPGLAIVSLNVDSLDDCPFEISRFHGPEEAPYYSANAALLEGPSGEWIELIEGPETESGDR